MFLKPQRKRLSLSPGIRLHYRSLNIPSFRIKKQGINVITGVSGVGKTSSRHGSNRWQFNPLATKPSRQDIF